MSFWTKAAAVPDCRRHSSSSKERMPVRLPRMSSRVGSLSWYSIDCHGTPSASYSFCCWRKTSALNCCWSISLAKLMQSCSNELTTNCSKPKISRMPMKALAAVSSTSLSLQRSTSHENRRPYKALVRASRESRACSSVSGTVTTSSRVTSCRVHRALLRSSTFSEPSRAATCWSAAEPASTAACSSSSCVKPICASRSTAANRRSTQVCSFSSIPTACIAPRVFCNSAESSTPSIAVQPL
mmetsp:Transcript_36849/g.97433  ORF Transcript_36849/g.97433 Transcript_36849/m.97433 type:complete len:241 (-) Transcript_36849:844-1566(-)